jgi:phytanoyl-CoA hydroxylase
MKTFSIEDRAELHDYFWKQGFVVIDDLVSPDDVRSLVAAFDEAVAGGEITLAADAMVDCNDVVFRHPTFERWGRDPRIATLVERLVGCQGLELQHSKLNSKPLIDAGGGSVPWHQDYPFFPHTNFDLIAVGIHLDDEDEDSAPLVVAPRSHTLGVLSHCRNGEFTYECTDEDARASAERLPLPCRAGNVTVHHCLTLHHSAQKRNDRHRRLLVFEYRALDNVQLAGVIWKCTGMEIRPGPHKGFARFADGSRVELRGRTGRLYDKFGKLAPDG